MARTVLYCTRAGPGVAGSSRNGTVPTTRVRSASSTSTSKGSEWLGAHAAGR